jgi:uncharacterized protein (DUF736 family)
MSQTYDNTNTGVLFKNEKKESDKHPDYTGKINVNGEEMKLAAWIKTGAKGKFMSLKLDQGNYVKPTQQAQQPRQAHKPAQQQAPIDDDFNDDIPF